MAKHLITSALPYINGIKHLGNLIGSLLPADVSARFLRQQGETVLFVCGTDEHGTPAELAAQAANLPVETFCAEMYQTQKAIYEQFHISCDTFGRSSCPENHALTQHIFKQLNDNGYIIQKSSKQVYSNTDKRFLPDRYVTGTCPHCQYDKARGDQCDGCGKLLDPTELINPRSSISNSTDVEVRETAHLYLDLPKLTPILSEWVEQQAHWPAVTKGIARKWLQEGLTERCISRDLDWGVSIPLPGYENKVFYVWFDAPIAYIGMTMAYAASLGKPDTWKDWWQSDDVTYHQFMAKDNVPFHAVFWPSMLLGTQEPWHLADQIKGFNWLNYAGGKFSTSQQRGVFTDQALKLFPADYWRYYLLSIAPESTDANFTFTDFAHTINKDLADTLGNFLGRVAKLVSKYMDGKLPTNSITFDESLIQQVSTTVKDIQTALTENRFRAATQSLRALWVIGNEFITHQEPWKLAKTDLAAAINVLSQCCHLIKIYAIVSAPFIPSLAQRLFDCLNESGIPADTSFEKACDCKPFEANQAFTLDGPLIQKISDEQVDALETEYAGHD